MHNSTPALAPDLSAAQWRKSTHSPYYNGDCVEVADGVPGVVPVRDSKCPGPLLVVPCCAWQAFVDHVADR